MSSDRATGWLRTHGFLLGLAAAAALAFVLPEPGARGGWLRPEILGKLGVVLILFLQGWSLPFEQVRAGAANVRLHAVVQGFTFVVFPLAGLALGAALPALLPVLPPALREGFVYLCVLPSTVSSAVVFTAVARGNAAGALFNAAFSNVAGVLLTPVLVHLLLRSGGAPGPLGPLLLQVVLLTLVPFASGALLRRAAAAWIDARRRWVVRLCNGAVLTMVYFAFCESVAGRVWERHGFLPTALAALLAAGLFAAMALLAAGLARAAELPRGDFVAACFGAPQKTLALGVPLALVIFGSSADTPLLLLPILCYHAVQLLAHGALAQHWARTAPG